MIRLILCTISVVLYLILTLPILLLINLIGKKNPAFKDKATYYMIRTVFKLFLLEAGTKITVIGKERIPVDEPCLFIGNHRSIFDIIISYTLLPYLTAFVAKIELKKVPIFRFWADNMKTLFLDRSNLKEGMKMIMAGIAMIKGGESIFIFPEGTRSRAVEDTPLLELHDGSFRMASKTGCPVVPVAINNAANIMEAHSPWIRSTHVVVEFCQPFYIKELAKEDQKRIGAYTKDILEETLIKNKPLISK